MGSRRDATRGHSHGHLWLIGLLGLAAGLILLLYVPSLPAVSGTFLLFVGFHLVGVIVLLSSLHLMAGRAILRHLRPARAKDGFDFGWAPGWMLGPWLAALILLAAAAALQLAAPPAWPLAMGLTLLAAGFFAGGLAARAAGRYDHAVLPMVALLPGGEGTILDAGCGAGRTTVALGRAFDTARITALDRFDSDYIDDGGRTLFDHNVRRAGLTARVRVEAGDLTALPLPEGGFDAAVSAHAIDHLGPHKEQGLREILRVLKPGGRFLLIVWVPGWTMFALVNVLSLLLSSKRDWRRTAGSAGFAIADEGMMNGYWFALLTKPAA